MVVDDAKLEYGAFARDFDVADGGMLAKATRTLQEHVRDVAEKTKSSCCVGGCGGRKAALAAEKERMRAAAAHDGMAVRYVYDNVTGTTYARGRLLGKVGTTVVVVQGGGGVGSGGGVFVKIIGTGNSCLVTIRGILGDVRQVW